MESDLKELQFIISAQYADDLKIEFDAIRSSEIGKSIDRYILRNQIDMLFLCTYAQGFLDKIFHKSIIKNISSVASYPVLILQ